MNHPGQPTDDDQDAAAEAFYAPASPMTAPLQAIIEEMRAWEDDDHPYTAIGGWADRLAALLDGATGQQDAREKAQAELETMRMQLAACMAAALGNTHKTVAARINRDHPYWSATYHDICRAVDREIANRERAEAAEAAVLALTAQLRELQGVEMDGDLILLRNYRVADEHADPRWVKLEYVAPAPSPNTETEQP